jgi:acylphosphatase
MLFTVDPGGSAMNRTISVLLALTALMFLSCRGSRPVQPATQETLTVEPAVREQADQPASGTAEAPVKQRRVHAFVSGQVQGVGFRDFTQGEARKRGLTGWVKNLEDGRVEAVIEGPADKVAELLEQLKHGPPRAQVKDVQVTDEKPTGEFKVFEVRGR